MPPDIRWQQRFANVCQALDQLETFPGLPPEASARLLAVLSAEPAVQEVWLYGSRAMGRHRPGSDINLSLQHELPEPLCQQVARVGRRLVPS